MRVLGIDPAINITGYGLLEKNKGPVKLLETGTVVPNRKDLFQNRIQKVYLIIGRIIDEFNPDVLILEKLYAHHKHPMTASVLGHVRGIICLLCAEKKINLEELGVKRIRKALIGNGNATKKQTRRVVSHILKINEVELTLDASDALALALGYIQIQGHSL